WVTARAKAVRLYILRENQPKAHLLEHPENIVFNRPGAQPLAVSADGRRLACGQKESVRLWDLSGPAPKFQTLAAEVGTGHGLAVSPDAHTLAATGDKNKLQLWDLGDGPPKLHLTLPAGVHMGVLSFSPDGKLLAGSSFQNDGLFLWDTTTWRLRHKWDLAAL